MTDILACQVLVLGGGPAGYVCAIRAGALGLDTVLVEGRAVGGTCLNEGCIPSKALIHAADEFYRASQSKARNHLGIEVAGATIDLAATMGWKDGIVGKLNSGVESLLRRAGVRVVRGTATVIDGKSCSVEVDGKPVIVTTEHLVLATGSEPVALPALPFGGAVLSSSDVLNLKVVPKRLAVIGGGYIGLELGTAFRKLGAAVTVLEAADHLLGDDPELVKPVMARLQELGVDVHLGARALAFDPLTRQLTFEIQGEPSHTLEADAVLVTVGRTPRSRGNGVETLDLAMTGNAITIDDQCRTSMHNVWAIGDVTGAPMLAHRAMAQGEMVAEIISGRRRSFDHNAIPAICYTDPEIVTSGLSPVEAKAKGIEVKTAKFPFSASGRALSVDAPEGFVRVVTRANDGVILGAQATGTGVSELAAVFTLAVEMGSTLEDIAGTIHAHPSMGEAFQEASFKLLGRGVHG